MLAINPGINHCPQVLKNLYLSNNSLGSKSAEMFGELLTTNRTLAFLDLSWNMVKVGEGGGM